MERTSVKTLKNILNFDDYSRSMFYVGFFMKNEIAKISYEAAHQKALLWFLQNVYEYPGIDVFWKAWLLPKRQIMGDNELKVRMPLLRKMRSSGMIMTRKEYLAVCRSDREFRHELLFQKDAPVDLCVDLMMSSFFCDIASRYFFMNRKMDLLFIFHDDVGFDLVGTSEEGRSTGIRMLKELRQKNEELWRCVLSCEGEFINTNTEYPYQIQNKNEFQIFSKTGNET